MNVKEFYQKTGADYEDIIRRLTSEEIILKYLKKFPNDNSLELLRSSLSECNYEVAVDAAHTLKGLCSTLGFPALTGRVTALYDCLRKGVQNDTKELLTEIITLYEQLVGWIRLVG